MDGSSIGEIPNIKYKGIAWPCLNLLPSVITPICLFSFNFFLPHACSTLVHLSFTIIQSPTQSHVFFCTHPNQSNFNHLPFLLTSLLLLVFFLSLFLPPSLSYLTSTTILFPAAAHIPVICSKFIYLKDQLCNIHFF